MPRGDLRRKNLAKTGASGPDAGTETEPRGCPSGRNMRSAPGDEPAGRIHTACTECLGTLAHQLSQPLTALRGSMELALLAERSAAGYRAALNQALDLTGHFAYLIASLRELAEAAAPGGVPQRVLLGAVVGEAVEELRGLAASRRVETVLAVSEELPVWVPLERLRDAVLRLLQHVIQGSPEKGVIQISLSKSNGRACLAIMLPGQGARRGNRETGRSASSLGRRFSEAAEEGNLEWAIAQTLVEAMRGTLQVDSGAPQGVRHCLCLPLAEEGTA